QVLLAQLEPRVAVEHDVVRETAHHAALAGGARELEDRVRGAYRDAALTPPWPKELAAALGADEASVVRVVQFFASRGELVRVKEDLYFDRAALEGLQGRLVDHLR